jgi:hypothetical protein
MTRRLGPGRLQIARPDGSVREILACYEAGFDGEPRQGWTYDTAVLALYCEDPYWRDVAPTTVLREFALGADFLRPFMTVSSSRTLGETQIDNRGDVEAWPAWTITGPASSVGATNSTTGEAFTLTHTLLAGQIVGITTDPPTVRGPAGEVLTGSLDWPGARLWALQPGVNDVDFQVGGSGPGTRIELSYYQRYETA